MPDAGLRGVLGQSVLKFPAPDAASFEESLDVARAFLQTWQKATADRTFGRAHAPFTCTPEIPRLPAWPLLPSSTHRCILTG